jgi:AraC family transcriptional regulator, L-arginine-responsive activator
MDKIMNIAVYVPGPCSLFSIGAVYEPFLLCNAIGTNDKYRLFLLSDDSDLEGKSADSTFPAIPKVSWDYQHWDLLIVMVERAPNGEFSPAEIKSIQTLYKYTSTQIMAIQCGVYWLAKSGILGHGPIALHWSELECFKACFPKIEVTPRLFSQTERITTCAGMTATLDCVIHFLEQHESSELIAELTDRLCMDRIRSGEEKQRLPSRFLGRDIQPRLTMALELMENNLEEPLSTDDIAQLVHISRRQLERLFKQYLGIMPAKYYVQLRLERAKQLLCTTNISIVQVGLSCGFSSGPHFSASYKSFYDITPREERAKRLSWSQS